MATNNQPVRELWNSLFDNSLESFRFEDDRFRSLALILHVLQMEFNKTKFNYVELQQINERQAEEIQRLRKLPELHKCRAVSRSPLKSISINETTPTKLKPNTSIFEDEEDADMFNIQINETDVNSSKENDNSLFIDNSLDDFEISTSPTLNKTRRLSRASKKDLKPAKKNETISPDCSIIILGTPVKPIKNLKQSKLSNCYSKFKSSTLKNNTSNASANNNCSKFQLNDSDETLCMIAEKVPNKTVDVDEILKQLNIYELNKRKKPKLDCSFDCLPDRSTSPDFVYKGQAVRKKAERLQLPGWNCPDCEKYYSKISHLTDSEMKKRMNICSRHRNKFNPNILTPKGFWDLEFSPTQESPAFDV